MIIITPSLLLALTGGFGRQTAGQNQVVHRLKVGHSGRWRRLSRMTGVALVADV